MRLWSMMTMQRWTRRNGVCRHARARRLRLLESHELKYAHDYWRINVAYVNLADHWIGIGGGAWSPTAGRLAYVLLILPTALMAGLLLSRIFNARLRGH